MIPVKVDQVFLSDAGFGVILRNEYLECRLARVEICDIKEGVFYARLILIVDEREVEVDSRPSDAIALALRADAPLFVDEKVVNEAGRIVQIGDAAGEKGRNPGLSHPEQKTDQAKPLSPLDALQQELARVVAKEEYEDAARIRDEIKKLNQELKDSHAGN